MTVTRKQILTFGPILLVATCYAIAAPSHPRLTQGSTGTARDQAIDSSDTEIPLAERCRIAANQLRGLLGSGQTLDLLKREDAPHPNPLPARPGRGDKGCRQAGAAEQMPVEWNFIVREPFVLASDLATLDLDDRYLQIIVPTVRALAVSYFKEPLQHPITIVICSSDERFRECNLRLDGQERDQYSGIYVRKHRRIIVNIASGDGTLAHELTHALAHADFPTMPEWIEEGLASLHEECEFSADGLHLIGNPNWRREVALEALQQGELRLLEDVSSNRFGSAGRANLDYAYVRTFCLYLQELGLLESFYHTSRSNIAADPTGLRSLCQVTETTNPRAIDDAFRAWLIEQRPVTQNPSEKTETTNPTN